MDRRRVVALLAAGLVVLAVAAAARHPDLAPGGGSRAALGLQLAAGLALVAAAVHAARRNEPAVATALLIAVAGLALGVLPEPPESAVLFTLALVGVGLPAAAAAHAALLYPGGRPAGALDRVAIGSGYILTAGLLRALVFDPPQAGCFDCPDNLLLVFADPDASAWLERWTPRVAAATEVALATLVAVRWLHRPAAARVLAAPVSAAAVVVLALAAIGNVRGAPLWLAACAALAALAAGFAWRPLRARRARAVLTRIAVTAPAGAGEVVDALGRALDDPAVALLVPHPETRAPITPDGAPAATHAPPGRARTAVERRGEIVAWVEHRATPDSLARTVAAAGLTLERESLRTAQRLQARQLRESSLRLVTAGEAERRRLERDLHDGAQQRLLALGLGLARARSTTGRAAAEALWLAEVRVAAIREQLRELAHGIHSVTLAEGGLAEAVLALVQAAGGGVAVDALPERRFPAAAEAAVYRLVAASLALEGAVGVRIAIEARPSELDAAIRVSGVTSAALSEAVAHAGARVFAVGGSLAVAAVAEGAAVRASVPDA
ncbi:histidine kinase [Solirubrobacter ginsenosidimutans]|uniref:Histidine kinase n=1 Tax=Solirubrobacter ginsenosidimutans TaxID=490573 RepID=A0A9X3MQE6_9ACTN|nr:histidine kinase [Solirubrobacter ginsenosidimutans]MDA0160759.1 histidine kinase [Solirubrobacter ginsenosidimutans]